MCLFHVRINKFVLRAQSCRFACNSQAQARCPGACALDAAMVNAFDVGAIYVPREEDDGRERAYAQWTGPCPCAETCSTASWNRVKSKLWTYDDQNEVVKLVVHHLTHSANHMMTDEEAHATVIAHLEAYPESMTQGTEDFDQREAYRRWTGAIRGGGTTASAAKAATNDYLSSLEQLEQPPPMTTMMTEAMAQVEALNEDDMKGVRDAARAVALLTNNDVDLGLGVRALVPRRGAKRPVSNHATPSRSYSMYSARIEPDWDGGTDGRIIENWTRIVFVLVFTDYGQASFGARTTGKSVGMLSCCLWEARISDSACCLSGIVAGCRRLLNETARRM